MIHLKHAENGFHIAYTELEAKVCEKNGWKRCDMAKEHEAARKAKEPAAQDIQADLDMGEEVVKRVNKKK